MDADLDSLAPEDRNHVRELMMSHEFSELTETQEVAFNDGVLEDGNHLLVAETGNGKTLVAEAVSKKRLEEGAKVAYLVPSRQLVRDKQETIEEWADNHEVSSGSGKYHKADIAVATFASFYRAILQDIGDARNVDLVVLDDFHEIYGNFLGPEIEKAISAVLYEDIEIFAMSATIGNPSSIGNWLDADVTVSPEGRKISINEETVEYSGSKKDAIAEFVTNNTERGPFLVFNFAKSWTESRASAVSSKGTFSGMNDVDAEDALESRLDGDLSTSMRELAQYIENGVAYHHSDLPQPVREYIEDLYYEDKLGCLFSTTTIAYGFDAPVQTVVIADIKRRSNWVGVWEYQQWIGRCARPGYGYDEGFAYTVTKEPETVRERYFEPRRLEPVKTHIEDDSSFRKFILELVSTGWNTHDELLAFAKNTLYWEQLVDQGSWGQSEEMMEELLADEIRAAINWLEDNQFTTQRRASEKHATTDFGQGATEFLFDTFGSYSLVQVRDFYSWLSTKPNLNPLQLTFALSKFFNESIKSDGISTKFSQRLQQEGIEPTDPGVTAGTLVWYWAENKDSKTIEEEVGIDGSYVYTTASRISTLLDASISLFASSSDVYAPNWLETFKRQVERGVRAEEIPLVENVPGLGRYRVRELRNYLNDPSVEATESVSDDAPLYEQLTEFYEHVDNRDQFVDVLRGTVTGIGPKTAKKLADFAENNIEFEEESSGEPSSLDEWLDE